MVAIALYGDGCFRVHWIRVDLTRLGRLRRASASPTQFPPNMRHICSVCSDTERETGFDDAREHLMGGETEVRPTLSPEVRK